MMAFAEFQQALVNRGVVCELLSLSGNRQIKQAATVRFPAFGIPKQYVVQEFLSAESNVSRYKWIGCWYARGRFGFIDFQYP